MCIKAPTVTPMMTAVTPNLEAPKKAPKILESPKKNGDKRRILEKVTTFAIASTPKLLKKRGTKNGMRIQAKIEQTEINKKKEVNMELTYLFKSPSELCPHLLKKGTKIEAETREAAVAKIRSGTSKEA